MDVAYNQHSQHARRKNRSTSNLNHLTLAPLTTRLPLDDQDDLPDYAQRAVPQHHTTSYLRGKSAPTTPGLLSTSPARSRSHDRRGARGGAGGSGGLSLSSSSALPKSRSTTHLLGASRGHNHRHHHNHNHHGGGGSGAVSPNTKRRRDDLGGLSARDRNDSDWLLRAGALISSEARESKGQSWLATRESSTSLTGMRDAEEEALEREWARERELASREASRHASRRGSISVAGLDDAFGSLPSSRLGSRSHSRVGSRSQMLTPIERRSSLDQGYFDGAPSSHEGEGDADANGQEEDYAAGPDFVNLDEKLEAIEQDTSIEDEDHVRRLVKREKAGLSSWWFGNVIGWPLFAVQENDEEDDEDEEDGSDVDGELLEAEMQERRRSSVRQFEGVSNVPEDAVAVPPPKPDEGGWQDAAWLLSVASKVIL